MNKKKTVVFTLCTAMIVTLSFFGPVSYGVSYQGAGFTDVQAGNFDESEDLEGFGSDGEEALNGSGGGEDGPLDEVKTELAEVEPGLVEAEPELAFDENSDEELFGNFEAVNYDPAEIYINNNNFPHAILESGGGTFILEEDIIWTKGSGDSGYAPLQVKEATLLELDRFSIHVTSGSRLEISGPMAIHGRDGIFYVEGQLALQDGVSVQAEGENLTVIHINSTDCTELDGVEITAVGDGVCGILVEKGTLKGNDSLLRLEGERTVGITCNEKQAVYGDLNIEISGHGVTGVRMAKASVFGMTGDINIEGNHSAGMYFAAGVVQDTEAYENFRCIMRGDGNTGLQSEGDFAWSLLVVWMWGENATGIYAAGDVYLKYCDLQLKDGGMPVISPGEVTFDTCCLEPFIESFRELYEFIVRIAFPVYELDDEGFPFKGYSLYKYGIWFPKGQIIEEISFPESLTFYLYDNNNREREMDVLERVIEEWDIEDYDNQEYGPFNIWYETKDIIEKFNISRLNSGIIPLRFYDPDGLFISHATVTDDFSVSIHLIGDLAEFQDIRFWVSDDETETWVDFLEQEKAILQKPDEGDVMRSNIRTNAFSMEEYYFLKLEAIRDGEVITSEEFMFHIDDNDLGQDRYGSDREDQGEERPGNGDGDKDGNNGKDSEEKGTGSSSGKNSRGQAEARPDALPGESNYEAIAGRDALFERSDLEDGEGSEAGTELTAVFGEDEDSIAALGSQGSDAGQAGGIEDDPDSDRTSVFSGRQADHGEGARLTEYELMPQLDKGFLAGIASDDSFGSDHEAAETTVKAEAISLYYGTAAVMICGILFTLYLRRRNN